MPSFLRPKTASLGPIMWTSISGSPRNHGSFMSRIRENSRYSPGGMDGDEMLPPPPSHVSPHAMRLDPLGDIGSSVPIALPLRSRTFRDAAGVMGWSNRVSTGTIDSVG